MERPSAGAQDARRGLTCSVSRIMSSYAPSTACPARHSAGRRVLLAAQPLGLPDFRISNHEFLRTFDGVSCSPLSQLKKSSVSGFSDSAAAA